MQLPAFVMATVMPELARRAADPAAFLVLLQRALDVMLLLALPVLLGGVFAEQLLTTIGGPGYADADTALRLLLFGLACAYVQTVFGHALVAQGLQSLAFRVALVVLVVNLVLNLALIPVAGIVGAGIALALSELLSLLLMWRRFGTTGERPAIRLSVAQALAGAAMLSTFVIVRWIGDRLGWPDVVTILSGGGLGSLAYGGVLMSRGALPVDLRALAPAKWHRSSR
jgi:O-antigen/teichoic acid export membrane protein